MKEDTADEWLYCHGVIIDTYGKYPQLAFGSQQFNVNSMIMSHELFVTMEGEQQLTSDGFYSKSVSLARIDARIKP